MACDVEHLKEGGIGMELACDTILAMGGHFLRGSQQPRATPISDMLSGNCARNGSTNYRAWMHMQVCTASHED